MEAALTKVSFPNIGSEAKIMNTRNTTASSYHSKVRSTQNMVVPLFYCLGHGVWYNVSMFCLFFSDSSNLTNLIEIQRWHQSGKWIISVSNGVYTLFRRRFLLFQTQLSTRLFNLTKNHAYLNLVYRICQRVDIYRYATLVTYSLC